MTVIKFVSGAVDHGLPYSPDLLYEAVFLADAINDSLLSVVNLHGYVINCYYHYACYNIVA